MQILFKFITGVSIGFEIHDDMFNDETGDKLWGMSIDLLIIRFMFIKY